MAVMETPSRILRRIEALEAQDSDLPSLPSLPAFEDSGIQSFQASSAHSISPRSLGIEDDEDATPYQSTPAHLPSHTTRSTIPPASSTSSAMRFANSMRTSMNTVRRSQQDSFEVSAILSTRIADNSLSSPSIPDVYLPPDDRAQVQDINRSRSSDSFSPDTQQCIPTSKKYDYSISLRSEPRASPMGLNRNVSLRKSKPLTPRIRTPSLSRTTPSPTSESSTSTPRSTYSHFARNSPSPSENDYFEAETTQPQFTPDIDREEDLQSQHSQVTQDSHQNIEREEDHNEIFDDRAPDGGKNSCPDPTFSSEHNESSNGSERARTPFPNAFSSPMQPNASTATPTFAPRVRSVAISTPINTTSTSPDEYATPYNRRRSFLLSLVNSTTRPRMTFPTPHPHSRAAPTPRPRGHPLSQAWTPAHLVLPPRSAPNSRSSDFSNNRDSFISTASSHDLTVHPRANASFDPTTGAKGVGRFNAVKLNTYLHGLNRRLQEENEMLVARLRAHGEELQLGEIAEQLEKDGFKGVEEAVLEGVEDMRDELEKCEIERDTAKAEAKVVVELLCKERDELKNDLDGEREERQRDKERWKERMAEVERGVEGVIKELEKRLEDKSNAELVIRELEDKCRTLEEELEVTNRRAEKAEDAIATSADLTPEVKQAYQQAAQYEEQARVAQGRVEQLERKLQDLEPRETQLRESFEDQLAEMDTELRQSLEAQQSAEAHAFELQDELKISEERVGSLEEALTTIREEASQLMAENEELRLQLERQKSEATRAAEVARQMEDALDESERKMIADGEQLSSLRTKLSRLENELDVLRERSHDNTSHNNSLARTGEPIIPDIDIEQLEVELDQAHKEIGRLNHLLADSPSRKAIEKAKDVRIELLEKEKGDLTERVRALTTMLAVTPKKLPLTPQQPRMAWRTPKTPGPPLKDHSWMQDKASMIDASPLVSQIEHLQHELHLANDSIDDKVNQLEEAGMGIVGLTEKLEDARTRNVTLEEEVGRLIRREDRRIRRLGRARCLKCGGRVDMDKFVGTSKTDQSSVEISSMSALLDPPTPPSKTTEALRASLAKVNSQLKTMQLHWDGERKELLGEKAELQNATNRLNNELQAAKDDAKRALEKGRINVDAETKARDNVQTELDKAKKAVAELEDALSSERSRLRALSMEQKRVLHEKDSVFVQLQRAQSDMDEVRTQLEKFKRDNHELEAELRVTTTIDQKARRLEAKVSENQEVIEQLRGERESLVADHANLQRQYVEASAQVNRLRQEFAASQTSHDQHRYELDLRVSEIEELRRELSEQAREMEMLETEKNQAQAERCDIVRTVASLEMDLKRVRYDAEALGKDLKALKNEHDKSEARHRDELSRAERAQKQLQAQIRLANEQLEIQREKAKKAVASLEGHVCQVSKQDIEVLRTQHKEECKGLMVQMRYFKAKFTRESVFRADLGYQKRYLLSILSCFEKSEKQIQAAIARIGFPLSQADPGRKRPTLRTVGVVALFIVRTKRTSESWRDQSASRTAMAAALQEVRRRRIAGSLGYS